MSFEEKFVITPRFLTAGTKRRSGLRISPEVKFIVVHDTGNPDSSAAGNVRYYENSNNEMSASAHIFVDDKEIVECIPALTGPPEKAWHVRYNLPTDNRMFGHEANDTAIGIEYCYGTRINADAAYNKYVWVIAFTCYKFELDPRSVIVGHYFLDPERRTDPITGLAHSRRTFEQLLRDVASEYDECSGLVPDHEYDYVEKSGTVRAVVRLNIRKNAPNTRTPVARMVLPGEKLEFIGWVENGQEVNGNAKWYKDLHGDYFWSGGTEPATTSIVVQPGTRADDKIGWGLTKLDITEIWEESRGEAIKVAILDTGIDRQHTNLVGAIEAGWNIVENNEDFQDSDPKGHGTHCAGIIAGQGKEVVGVAPDCRLYIGKIMDTCYDLDLEHLLQGIAWAISNKVHIISLSLGFRTPDEKLHKSLQKALNEKNIIAIAAAGNAGQTNKLKERYPASFEECVSVGSVDLQLQRDKISNLSNHLDFLAPGKNIYSTSVQNGFATESGTSMAAAFVSGVFALMLGFIKANNLQISAVELLDLMKKNATDYGSSVGRDSESGYGIINAIKSLDKIKSESI